ncbi:hypothetical protein [Streptomyces prasinopilosus]|uniref:hypothetical protein n=1 Tax=Streptomyces prasinopilosus TaxID=67344 RepID=UPI0006EB6A24|nr:hypothetical protein [Streptomyces prasinopilosus]
MAWDEWEQLKAAAAERHTAQTLLNRLPADPGGGAGTLLSNRRTWTEAGTDIGSLREDIGRARRKLKVGQAGLGKESGCLTAAAQKGVHVSWETYLENLGWRCGKLSDLLVRAGTDQYRTDESVEAEIAGLEAAYADTPAVGGQGKGR